MNDGTPSEEDLIKQLADYAETEESKKAQIKHAEARAPGDVWGGGTVGDVMRKYCWSDGGYAELEARMLGGSPVVQGAKWADDLEPEQAPPPESLAKRKKRLAKLKRKKR